MALITCPDCGKQVSNRATACPDCGCPIGSLQGGILRVECRFFGLFGNCRITVNFCGKSSVIKNGFYDDFPVPSDGKTYTATILRLTMNLTMMIGLYMRLSMFPILRCGEQFFSCLCH